MKATCQEAAIDEQDNDGCSLTFTDKSDLNAKDAASTSLKQFVIDIATLGLTEHDIYTCPNCGAIIDPNVVQNL